MLKTVAALAVLLVCAFSWVHANGLLHTLLSLRLSLEGYSTAVIGPVVACYSAGFLIGTLVGAHVLRRVGHIRAFAAFAATASIVALVHPLFVDPIAWGLLRVISGFVLAGLAMTVESWIGSRATRENRGQVLSVYMTVNFIAWGGSQFLLGLYSPGGAELFTIVAILFAASLIPLSLAQVQAPPPARRSRLGLAALYRVSPLGLAGALAAGLVNSAFTGLGPVFAQGMGLSIAAVSQFMGFAILSGLVLQFPAGRLSDRFDRRKVLLSVTGLVALAAIATASLGPALPGWGLLAVVCVYAGLTFTLYPLAVAHTQDFVAPGDAVAASAGMLMVMGAGACVGPFLASAAMDWLGPRGLFAYTATVILCLLLFGLYRMTRRAPLPKEQQGDFVAMPGVPPVLAELDPRSEPASGPLADDPDEPWPEAADAPPGAAR